ncbi:hypothetical protein F3W81_05635 [Pseudooceanicola spongiae]|uniref:Uncharacterized protein n=1 Tax=Pseudooceanicola spongiae TaxID=2613965 RepID=A0A7L9WLD5_9RHOB|nr:hypothetical protein F3W81_05635 [Pseudooceanicola spongiae]
MIHAGLPLLSIQASVRRNHEAGRGPWLWWSYICAVAGVMSVSVSLVCCYVNVFHITDIGSAALNHKGAM